MTSPTVARGRKVRTPPPRATLPDARAVLHALGDAAWIVDARTLVLLEMNAAGAALLGVRNPAAAVLHAVATIATPEDQAFWATCRPATTARCNRRPPSSLPPTGV